MTVLLVRHGETTWNVEGRIQGWAGAPLSGRGREQARTTGETLASAGVDRLVVSDLQRTQETARLLAEGGLDVDRAFESAWRERDFGDYQGLDRATVAERHAEFDADGSLTGVESVPGGESRSGFLDRVREGWRAVADAGHDETVAVVSHGGPIRAVVADVTDRGFETLAREWSPENCGITEIDVTGHPTVVRRDDTGHLD